MFSWINKIWLNMCSWTASAIGNGIMTSGEVIQQLAMLVIVLGILLWTCKCTKVFRIGIVSWILGLILQILGLLIR